jgi:hypothetical protein
MEETEYSQKAIEAVKRDQPDGQNFWVPYVFQDDFYGGTLVIVRFQSEDGQDVQNNVFFDRDHKLGVYYRTEDLAKALSGRKSLSPLSRFLQDTGITGFIAVLITMTIVYLVVKDPAGKIPEVMTNALGVILGFYFGTKVKK